MSVLPEDTEFRVVLACLCTLALVAVFAVADPIVRAGIALVVVFGGYFLFSRGKR